MDRLTPKIQVNHLVTIRSQTRSKSRLAENCFVPLTSVKLKITITGTTSCLQARKAQRRSPMRASLRSTLKSLKRSQLSLKVCKSDIRLTNLGAFTGDLIVESLGRKLIRLCFGMSLSRSDTTSALFKCFFSAPLLQALPLYLSFSC